MTQPKLLHLVTSNWDRSDVVTYSDEQEMKKMQGNGEPPYTGDMDRLDHLEKRVDNIDGRLERIEGDVATLKDDVGGIKTALVSLEGGLTAKFEALRADIHQSIAENSKWTHAATIGMFSVFILGGIGLLFTIWNATKPAPVAAQYPQPAPIIINVPATHPTLQPPARMPLQPSQIPEIAPEIGK